MGPVATLSASDLVVEYDTLTPVEMEATLMGS